MPHPYMDGRPLLASEVTFYTLLNTKFGALQYRLVDTYCEECVVMIAIL